MISKDHFAGSVMSGLGNVRPEIGRPESSRTGGGAIVQRGMGVVCLGRWWKGQKDLVIGWAGGGEGGT